jgi:manganese/zinc/iron transport system permease protein
MTDIHIVIYGVLAFAVAVFLFLLFRPLQAFLFDRNFAAGAGIRISILEKAFFWLLLLSLIVGIRSVGVVLMSGMAIAPAVAARQFSDRLQTIFWLAALFGAASGLIGNILSALGENLPTGPMIVLVGAAIALLSLCFAPKRGLIFRMSRIWAFRFRCLKENIVKGIWKKKEMTFEEIRRSHQIPLLALRSALWRLKREGWIGDSSGKYSLTKDGNAKAAAIVRLHRLWELYLTESLGFHSEKVHRTAEEMEHILTPELEERLTRLLLNPKRDPHDQPIPERPAPL